MDDAVIGREVDGYRIEGVLGRGGMGVVYQGEDVALSRPVALKRINPSQAHREQFLRRFRSEAKALARIDSPYIVSIYALRDTDIGLLIVMEYVDGGTLKDRVENGPMPPDEAIPILRQILQAFRDAHGAGVIHRDIKPQNIMLTAEGTVKITDFGIAKLRRPDSGETVTQGGQGGTLKYMSPEQIEKIDEVDDRSDLYALGMTAYEMLTGRLPFDELDTDFDIMRKVVEGKVPPPSEYAPNLPPALGDLIVKATETDPDDRYASAEEMLDALDGAADDLEHGGGTPMWDVDDGDTASDTAASDTAAGHTASGDTASGETVMAGDTALGDGASGNLADDGTILDDSLLEEIEDEDGSSTGERLQTDPDTGAAAHAETAKEASGSSGLSLGVVAGVVLAVLLLGAGGGYVLFGGGGSSLALQSSPSGAAVILDGDSVGVTPVAGIDVEPGRHALSIRKAGYVPLDTVVTVGDGQSLMMSGVSLQARPGQLSVTTEPSGARVLADGRLIGTTPLRNAELRPGPVSLQIEKEGHAARDTTVQAGPGGRVALAGLVLRESASGGASTASTSPSEPEPSPESPAEPQAASGQLTVDASSDVSVYVDGSELGLPGTYDLDPGTHEVECRHSDYEPTITRRVTLSAGGAQSLACVFEQTVNVSARELWGNIWINGENTGKSTTSEFDLGPGSYRVEVRINRDPNIRVEGGTYLRRVPGGDVEETSFDTPYVKVEIDPTVRPVEHAIVFITTRSQ